MLVDLVNYINIMAVYLIKHKQCSYHIRMKLIMIL